METTEKKVTLVMRAKHFKDISFCGRRCAVDMAAIDKFKTSKVSEWVDGITIKGKDYRHDTYGISLYTDDRVRAERTGYDNTIIRKITLIKQN